MRTSLESVVRLLLLAAVLAGVAGCGFQLRSYNFAGSVDSFAVTGKSRLAISQELRRGLSQAGVNEVSAEDAAIKVEILEQRRDRRSVSVAGSARAAEYETSLAVRYRILGAGSEELAPATWIERQRVYRIDRDNIVGSSEEQALLEAELMQDMVGQIIRAMEAVSRNANAGQS